MERRRRMAVELALLGFAVPYVPQWVNAPRIPNAQGLRYGHSESWVAGLALMVAAAVLATVGARGVDEGRATWGYWATVAIAGLLWLSSNSAFYV